MSQPIKKGIIAEWEGKRIPLTLSWRNQVYSFGRMEFQADNSFVLGLSTPSVGSPLDFGEARLLNNNVIHKPPDEQRPAIGGFHLTLHTPKPPKHKKGVIHIGDKENIFQSIQCDWFPINKVHQLGFYVTPPLGSYKPCQKKPPFLTTIPPEHNDSIMFVFDLFPRKDNLLPPCPKSFGNYWGFCPGYKLRIGTILTGQKWASTLYWPQEKDGLVIEQLKQIPNI